MLELLGWKTIENDRRRLPSANEPVAPPEPARFLHLGVRYDG
jgi:hypothetical protein